MLLWTDGFKLIWCTLHKWSYYSTMLRLSHLWPLGGFSSWLYRPSDMFPGVFEFPGSSGTFCAPHLESAMSPRIGQIFKCSDKEIKWLDGKMLVGGLVLGSRLYSLSGASSTGLMQTLLVALPVAFLDYLCHMDRRG